MNDSSFLKRVAWLVAALFLCLGPVARGQTPAIRIMPVGDSITDGSSTTNSLGAGGPGGGYRLPLWQMLTNAGYKVDYLGLLTINPSAVGMPTKHEGHSGWKIDQIYSNMVNAVFGAVEDPDVLLIMIGTNDFGQNYDENNATNRLSQLVGLVSTRWPYCKVIVASLTARSGADGLAIQTNFNNSVPGIVSNFQASGAQVYFTDMHPVVPLGAEFMPDNLHPNTGGYYKMATNWFPAITNVISPQGTTNAPVITRVSAVSGLSNVTVTFSKPVDDASATNVWNYYADGLSVLGATLEVTNKRAVTLTTSPMGLHSNYLLIVTGVVDRTVAATMMTDTLTNFVTYGASQRGAFNNVPEAGDYRLVYSLNIPTSPNFSAGITYDTDLRAYASNFTRVAYYLEVQPAGGPLDFAWVSFDAMTTNVNRIGVPTFGSGATFQQYVTNMNVLSSMPSVLNGTNIATGNIEFWPSNYSAPNAVSVPNASGTTYDWGDLLTTSGNYGSMQVHNYGASQVIWAFNHWNSSVVADLGIGNGTGTNNPDWTFGGNANQYTVKVLQVFALLASNVAPTISSSYGIGISNAVINFSAPVADDATNASFYAIGGLSVLGVSLDSMTKQSVSLALSPMAPGATYTAVVNNVHDRSSSNSLLIATNTTALIQGPGTNGVLNNVPAATNYTLVYSLNVPTAGAFNSQGVPYDVDARNYIGAFTRIAYYLELQSATGLPNYIWVEMDPFTTNVAHIGVPASASNPVFQQIVTNMTVQSSVAGIAQGAGIATGNIEFWPWDYVEVNSNAVPGASSANFDWGDGVRFNTGGHGSMQVHNHGASQVLFAFNNWGAAAGGTTAIGIGNRPGSANVDWTHAANSANYTARTLQVFVLAVSNTPPALLGAASASSSTVVLTFSKILDSGSIAVSNFAIAGVTVLGATLDPVTLARVTLTTTPLTPNMVYTSVVSNVRDRTTDALMVTPNSTAIFRTPAVTGAIGNVPEAADYQLVHSISLPAAPVYPNSVIYDVDLRSQVTNFTRVAYYLELQTNNGPVNFAWTSFDAVTNNIHAIGIPTSASGAIFQQPVTNLNVFCSVTSVVQDIGIGTGNIEFWGHNYGNSNAMSVPNATHTNFDWGDVRTAGNYGSMQVHNYGANLGATTGQVIFSFSKWGGQGGNCDIGIGNRPGSTDKDWTFSGLANTYTSRILQVYALSTTNLPPVVMDVSGLPGLSNVVIQFSKQLTGGAATITNFSIAGLTVLGATLDASTKTRVTLTTSPQTPATIYMLTIAGGIQDSTSGSLPLSGGPAYSFMSAPRGGAINNVPEASGYTLVYSLNVTATGNWSTVPPPYAVDNHFGMTAFSRIGYYLELQKAGEAPEFVWASMDSFSPDAGRIGVPVNASGAYFQQPVTNLSVLSSVFGVVNGTNMSGGNIEFWPYTSTVTNNMAVPNASGASYDWGDQPLAGNYGSMQIHNSAASQVLLALNNWGTTNTLEVGLGNCLINPHPDWTATFNAGAYTSRLLQIYVLPVGDTTAPTILSAAVTPDRTRVIVTFSEPLADLSASPANFAIDNGIVVSAAAMSSDLRQITLTVSELVAGVTYTLTVNNVRDRSANANAIAPNSQVTITPLAPPSQILANVPEATNFVPVLTLNIPTVAPNWNVNGAAYAVDNRNIIGPFSRVAYYMELATNATSPTNWVYVSIDPFTNDARKIGVPDEIAGAWFQQRVTNANILSSMTNIVSGVFSNGCNIEFWPFDYSGGNAISIPGASGSTLDFGDQISYKFSTSGHASMQIHNHSVSNVLFALNKWGGGQGGNLSLGIGSQPTGNPDWTFADNAAQFFIKNLYVLVQPAADTSAPVIVRARGGSTGTNIVLSFDEPVNASSASITNFTIDGGLTILTAALLPTYREILLTTSPQTPGQTYNLTVSNVRDLSAAMNLIAPAMPASFTAVTNLPLFALVPETAGYSLAYGLTLPAACPNYNYTNVVYDIDERLLLTKPYIRIAYFMELATNAGPTNWVYVSAPTFNTNINRIAVPQLGLGAGYQQRLTNLSIFSSLTNIVTGTNINTGGIEFYPFNFGQGTNAALLNGSSTNYDWSDTYNEGTGWYGAMQFHNYGAITGEGTTGQVLMAFNKWGGGQTGNAEMGLGSRDVGHKDWTTSGNGASFTTRNLYILVKITNAPAAPPVIIAPFFVLHPASSTAIAGTTNILAALAVGTAPAYQWRLNGTPITGATNSWLLFTPAATNDAGAYTVTASNTAGIVTSIVAVLSVTNLPPPPGGYDAWAAQITNGLTNDTDSALADGFPNLLKYATGSNPTNADDLAEMNRDLTNGVFALRFNHDTNATDITLIIEGAYTSTNDATWNGIATNIHGSWGATTNYAENTGTQPAAVIVWDTAGPSTNRFLRLRVTRP